MNDVNEAVNIVHSRYDTSSDYNKMLHIQEEASEERYICGFENSRIFESHSEQFVHYIFFKGIIKAFQDGRISFASLFSKFVLEMLDEFVFDSLVCSFVGEEVHQRRHVVLINHKVCVT